MVVIERGYLGLLVLSFVVLVVWIVGLPVTLIASIPNLTGHSAINFWLGKWWVALIAFIVFGALIGYLLKLCCEVDNPSDDISLAHTV
ncbi:MAG: hypothetical protein PHI73_03330 [Patescibacteria group bacterium]|nr:hypothetical protein [Patescibacteria group bacterium]